MFLKSFLTGVSCALLFAGCGGSSKELGAAKPDSTPKADPVKQQEGYMEMYQKGGRSGPPPVAAPPANQ